MSITDRQRATTATPTAPPQGPPDTSARVAEPAPKPYKHLIVAAIVLAVVGVAGFAVLFLNRPAATNQPPVVNAPPATSAPPLSERQQAAADAQKAYVTYVKAMDDLADTGGSAAAVTRAKSLSTSSNYKLIDLTAEAYQKQQIRGSGYSKVTSRVDSVGDLSTKRPVVQMATCVDSREMSFSTAGKPSKGVLVQGTAELTRVNGRWLVSSDLSPEGQLPASCTL